MADPTAAFGWREVVVGLSAGFTALLGVVWRRQQKDIDGKVDKGEIAQLLEKFTQHVADDRDLVREIREERIASEKSRAVLHEKFNRMSKMVVRLDERLAHIGTRSGEPLGPIGDGSDGDPEG